ncbi:helix-turn-helix domain-containing protein [Qipengyuania sp. GH1]|uniref:DNA methyltransferase n=1 Tax=Qipengyuania aestuarii TaxID=2867241 RepID=UPI001C883682|nr:DNA methyltransferase [Qipengyuania aestuarii]MBX7536220.1 helix-turn-helix domain-containing protein [Qipengyuania aestuarii]
MRATELNIRSRREALGLTLDDVAKKVHVTRSYLSRIETGQRAATEEQAAALAEILAVPIELVLIECGRLPSDVQGAIAANAAGVTAIVRSHAEQDAIVYSGMPTCPPEPKGAPINFAPQTAAVLPKTLCVSKATTSYRAHSYHTKVPPSAITPFIEAFSSEGDWVADPFCGSGMTGVAALSVNRNALLSDLSPAAVHITRNYTTPCDPAAFQQALAAVDEMVRPTMRWLYDPDPTTVGTVEYTTWSDVFACPGCSEPIVFWDVVKTIERDQISCPACGTKARKSELTWLTEQPVQSHVSKGSNRVTHHAPTKAELTLIEQSEASPIPYWLPSVAFGKDREMWRAGHQAMGIEDVRGFYSRRNLHALAALRHVIVTIAEGRVREALLFAFTACVNRASKRYQWNAKRPTNVMTGTLYVSSLRYEWNVWSLFRRKAADVLRYYAAFPKSSAQAQVYQRSATDLGCLDDGSVDFVFMDPPFGSNIFYADSSLLWDAWLGALTDQGEEIVVNKQRPRHAGGKDIAEYGGLMTDAFSEVARILRRGGRATLAFSNSNDRVWSAMQDAISDAGFEVGSVHLLDKGQPSIKGVKGQLGKEQVTRLDLMLCLAHRSRPASKNERTPVTQSFIDRAIAEALAEGVQRTDHIYSLVLREALRADLASTGITMPKVAERCALVANQDDQGNWSLSETVDPSKGQDFVAGYLERPNALPTTSHPDTVDQAPRRQRVAGGRNTSLYLAHSYHTKVPPEAITPFIEHYTQPGDVVMDPFSGSGMTGVAAALAGRRAILNDLSPAAAHLAWNHSRPCDVDALTKAFGALERKVGKRFAEIYDTIDESGAPATICWTIWSTRHRCPTCAKEFLLWDTFDQDGGRLGRKSTCPRCMSEHDRRRFEVIDNLPAYIAFERTDGTRGYKAADRDDVAKARAFRREDIAEWFPTTPLGPDREMYQRCALHLHGVRSVADMYTNRNLLALSVLWAEIQNVEDRRIQRALAFAFTNTAWHGTRMRRYNARGGHRPLTGTLYIPQLSSEANVLNVMRKKVSQLATFYAGYAPVANDLPALMVGSATELDEVASGSVDYVFTDPPFGSNIFYADCNVIWESWLGRVTDPALEAVVNKSLGQAAGGKSLDRYGALMAGAMREIARILKPGGWATVVFHNTDAEVWKALRDAADAAGFEFHEAASLDRQQQSHKGYKGREGKENVAHFDVVMNLRKPVRADKKRSKVAEEPLDLVALVDSVAREPAIASHGAQGIHAEVMRRLMSRGSRDFPDFAEVREIWAERQLEAH